MQILYKFYVTRCRTVRITDHSMTVFPTKLGLLLGCLGDAAGRVCPLHGWIQRQRPGWHFWQVEGGCKRRKHQKAQVEWKGHGQPGKQESHLLWEETQLLLCFCCNSQLKQPHFKCLYSFCCNKCLILSGFFASVILTHNKLITAHLSWFRGSWFLHICGHECNIAHSLVDVMMTTRWLLFLLSLCVFVCDREWSNTMLLKTGPSQTSPSGMQPSNSWRKPCSLASKTVCWSWWPHVASAGSLHFLHFVSLGCLTDWKMHFFINNLNNFIAVNLNYINDDDHQRICVAQDE